MNPSMFARMECANLRPDGSCLGIQPEGLTDTTIPAVPREVCLLKQKPLQRCLYFEKCVLPQADKPAPKDNPSLQVEKQEARLKYYVALDKPVKSKKEAEIRRCPDCGGPLSLRQRYCSKCSHKRRLESARNAMKEKRQLCRMPVNS